MNTCNHEIKYLYTLKKKNAYHLAGANCQHLWITEKSKRVPEKTSTSALFTTPKPLTV